MKCLLKTLPRASKDDPGPWRRKPPRSEDLKKDLGPLARPNYVPPKRGTKPYEKRRHDFCHALNLDSVYTPKKVYYRPKDGQITSGSRKGKKIPNLLESKKGYQNNLDMSERVLRPIASICERFPHFVRKRDDICYLSHMAVQFGVLGPQVLKDLRALSRMFWKIDFHGNWKKVTRRVKSMLSSASKAKFTKPDPHLMPV